jgi:hypothetical protein
VPFPTGSSATGEVEDKERILGSCAHPSRANLSCVTRQYSAGPTSHEMAELGRRSLGDAVRECADDGGRAVGNLQPAVNVLQMRPHGPLGQPELAGDLDVGAAASDQVQQVPLPGREFGHRAAPTLSIVVRLLEMGAQQREERSVALGEVRAGFAEKTSRTVRPGPASGPGGSERHS